MGPKPHPLPHPKLCGLYCVNKDALFSFHKMAEEFLQQLMSLLRSSRYEDSPNDLLLISDSPTNNIFVLLECTRIPSDNTIPNILCAIDVVMEGPSPLNQEYNIQGFKEKSEHISRTIAEQYQTEKVLSLLGGRIMQI